jgi:hypothetical protein
VDKNENIKFPELMNGNGSLSVNDPQLVYMNMA